MSDNAALSLLSMRRNPSPKSIEMLLEAVARENGVHNGGCALRGDHDHGYNY